MIAREKTTGSRTLLAAGIVAIAFSLRLIFASLSVRLPEIARDTGLSAWGISLLTTLPVLCLGLGAPFAPRLAARWGTERALGVAVAILAIGIGTRAAGPVSALFGFSLLAGSAIAVANVLLPSLVKRDFEDRSALLTGLYVMAISGGAALAAAATVPIEHLLAVDWHVGLAMWTLPVMLALLLWLPQTMRPVSRAQAPILPVRGLWRDRLAWQVSLFMGLQSALAFSAMSWLAPILRDRGLSAVTAGLVLSVLIVVQLLTCLTVPSLAIRARDQRSLAMLLVAGGVLGMLGLLFGPLWSLWGWALLQGLAQGGLFALALTMVILRSPNSHVAAHLSSMAQSVGYIPAAFAPLLIGLLHAWTGGFAAVGLLFGAIGAGLVWSGLGAGRSIFIAVEALPTDPVSCPARSV
jgi:CP family cyanate transporter-like MFS transporter